MNLGGSDPKIYKRMQWGGKLFRLADSDVISKLWPIESMGFRWCNDTHKLVTPRTKRFMAYNTPWCHARHLIGKHCALDHQVTFNAFGIIPPKCMNCWKTVLTPKNFDELVIWKEVQENDISYAAKCGIELRDYTPKHYGAYHYAASLDEGREQYEDVYKKAKKYLSKETAEGVILKRACTEYEMIKGPASSWTLTKEEERMLELIEAYVDVPQATKRQPQMTKPTVMIKWALWAHANGDFSYMKYNGDKKLFPDYQKFHKGDINDIKHDLAVTAAHAAGVDPAVAAEFLTGSDEFLRKHGASLSQVDKMIGNAHLGKLGQMDFSDIKRVDPATIGDDDVLPIEDIDHDK